MESATKMHKILYPAANYSIRILLALILSGLCLQSMFSTSFIGVITGEDGSVQDRTLNIADSPFRHLLVFVLSIAGLIALKRLWRYGKRRLVFCGAIEKIKAFGMLKILCILTGTAGCFWILITQLQPGSDPAKIYAIAMQWREMNFSAFAEGGYLFRYPYQAGIVLFYYLLSFLFGVDNFIALQLVNVPALILIYYYLAKLAGAYWKADKKIQELVYIALAAWLPLFFYITYLYGILPGMALSLVAVYMSLRYLETRKIRYMLIAALCIGLATVFKMNCLIYMAAVCCYLIYDIVVISGWKNRLRSVLFILFMILSVKGLNQAVYSYVEHLSGYETPDGEVMLSWVVMGLQDTPLGPGGYSGFIGDVFIEYHYDTEKITEASIAEIKKIVTDMSENWYDKGLPFFAKKNAFQWNDPTFIGLHLSRNRVSAISLSDSVQSILERGGRGCIWLSTFLNYVQTLILLGVLSFLISQSRSRNLYELFGGVIFLGGYLFHFFWESSASYTIPYFVILIPYAVKGLLDVAYRTEIACATLKNNICYGRQIEIRWGKKNVAAIAGLLMIFILLFAFTKTNLFANTIALNDGEAAREQFTQRKQASGFVNGYYTISPYLAEGLALTEQEGSIQTEPATNETTQKIAIIMKQGDAIFRFRDSEKVLAVLPEENNKIISYMDDSMNMFYEYGGKVYDQWTMQPIDEDSYYIGINGLALTYHTDDGEVSLEAYEGEAEQKWVLSGDWME